VIDLVVDALAVYRLTRLIVEDEVTRPPRMRLLQWFGRFEDGHRWIYLATCYWCVGWWCAFAVVAARKMFPRAWPLIARALAFSTTVGVLSTLTAALPSTP
jgi:hypothetical protein